MNLGGGFGSSLPPTVKPIGSVRKFADATKNRPMLVLVVQESFKIFLLETRPILWKTCKLCVN